MKEKTKILILTVLCLICCFLPIRAAASLTDIMFTDKDEEPVI